MSTGETAGPEHPALTRRSRYRYLFHSKHHGRGPRDAARWSLDLSRDEEFGIFDAADAHELTDERGNLFGLRLGPDGEVLDLGTRSQLVAEFPHARPNQPWHGYPLWPLGTAGPPNRGGQQARPSKAVFDRMEAEGLLTARDRKRLYKGEHL